MRQTSFNRTFMELKCSGETLRVSPLRFQSYLYGIEIEREENVQVLGRRFNRTFMELKFQLKQEALKHLTKFQSYLYGIEINEPVTISRFNIYSFNRTFMELKLVKNSMGYSFR